MKNIILLVLLNVLFLNYGAAQITYGSAEMPVPGDTFRISITASVGNVNYALTGTNYTWNFSGLQHLTQEVDTFVTVTSVPTIYQLFFNNPVYPNNRATVVMRQSESPIPIPNLFIRDVFNFFRNTSSFYALVGYGANINGSDVPVRFNNVDYIYRFPLLMGNKDSCTSDFAVSVPGVGYIGEVKKRKNTVDGWGTLTTPYGSFPTIRVKSELYIHDTVYYNSNGFAIDRIETEYKWLANGFGIPLLTVINSQTGLYVEYIDSIRPHMAINRYEKTGDVNKLFVYPNPCNDLFTITYSIHEKSKVNISLFSLKGEKIQTFIDKVMEKGEHTASINVSNLQLAKGIYYIRLISENEVMQRKLIIN